MTIEFTDAPLEPFGDTFLEIAVPTQLSYKAPLVFRIMKELTSRGYLPWTGSPMAELCFDEAVTNAMVHGNRLDPEKQVRVAAFGDAARWGVIVSDEGAGFSRDLIPDPNDPEYLLRESGRGIRLIESYVDALRFQQPGNRVCLVRARQSAPDAVEAQAAVAAAEAPAESEELLHISTEGPIQIVRVQTARVADESIEGVRQGLIAVAEQHAEIVLDLSRVEYISSMGLSTLVSLYKRVRAKNGHMILAGLQPAVRTILETTYLLKLFPTAPDRAQAVRDLMRMA